MLILLRCLNLALLALLHSQDFLLSCLAPHQWPAHDITVKHTLLFMARSLEGYVLRASRVVDCSSSSWAGLSKVDAAPLPESCPCWPCSTHSTLPRDAWLDTPVACTRHCNHAKGFHGAGLLEHHRPVGLALLTGPPPQWLDSTPFACKSISFLFTATVTQKTTTPERPQHIHYSLH